MALRFLPDEDPIGKRLDISGPTYLREIVGIVGDVRQDGLRRPVAPQVYEAFAQKPAGSFRVVVRAAGDPIDLVASVRREVQAIDRQQSLSRVSGMEQVVNGTIASDRLSVWLLTLFASIEVLLAALGKQDTRDVTYLSSTSRIFLPSASELNGLCRNAIPGLRTPCWTMASSVYPDM
jgi:hypothetical protein